MLRLNTLITTIALVMGVISTSHAAVLTHQWTLDGTAADTFGGANIVLSGAGTLGATGYSFASNDGPSISGSINASDYSIEVTFSLDNTGGYRKLIDFKNLASDGGLYDLNGTSVIYGLTGSDGTSDYTPGTLVHVVLTRDGATNAFAYYVNGALALSGIDAGGATTFTGAAGIVQLFHDDNAFCCEASSGFVDFVRFYDGALTATEVANLPAGQVAGPEVNLPAPGAWTLLGLGFIGAAGMRRRFMKRHSKALPRT